MFYYSKKSPQLMRHLSHLCTKFLMPREKSILSATYTTIERPPSHRRPTGNVALPERLSSNRRYGSRTGKGPGCVGDIQESPIQVVQRFPRYVELCVVVHCPVGG